MVGDANIEALALAVVVGACLFTGVFNAALWALRRERVEMEPWVALWAVISGGAVLCRMVQLLAVEPQVAIYAIRGTFAFVVLLPPVLFQLSHVFAEQPQWRRVGRWIWIFFGSQVPLAAFTPLYSSEVVFERTGLFGDPFLGVENGALATPFMLTLWGVYGLVFYVLTRSRMDRAGPGGGARGLHPGRAPCPGPGQRHGHRP